MIQAPDVSVIVPCFNYGRFLGEALDSVYRQSFGEWECIVIDDGSTDDTQAVARAYALRDARFSYVYQENGGLSSARNAGLRRATGKYVQLLDADDLIEKDKLLEQVKFLDQHEAYSLVYGPMKYFTTKGSTRVFSRGRNGADREWLRFWPDTNDEMMLALVAGNIFPVSAPISRKSLFEEVGYFDESLQSHEDWEFWVRCAFVGKRFFGLHVPRTETFIREHGRSMTTRSVVMIETRLKVRSRINEIAKSDVFRATNVECGKYDECELGAVHLAMGHWRIGLRHYFGGFMKVARKTRAIRLLLAHVGPDWLLHRFRRIRDTLSPMRQH